MTETPDQLLAACQKARGEGLDFPSVWLTILRKNPLVVGLPTHEVEGGEARILVRLNTGQTIVSTLGGYVLR